MELKLTKEAAFMLYRMFWQPGTLTEDKPYQGKDDIARADIVAIMRWLNTKVYRITQRGTPEERTEFLEWTGMVKQRFIDRMLDITKHYEKSGSQVHNVTAYTDLKNALSGKVIESESVEEEKPA